MDTADWLHAAVCEAAADGIAILPHRCYPPDMRTLTMKVPDGLLGWLEEEAKRAQRPKSALVREILQQHQQRQHQSALDLAADLCGCVQSGVRDLSRNKKHLKGFGR
jgi:predicted DNA-binding protein